MESLVIEKTEQSPEIIFHGNGNLLMRGVSITTNVQKFYEPVMDWLTNFKNHQPKKIHLIFELYYLNTSSALLIVDFLKKLKSFKEEGSDLTIVWKYEEDDEDILDLGEDMRISSKCDFEFSLIK